MNTEVYRRLADHLDRLPGGFAPSETGADLRLLQKLFTPEEAELAVHLTLERESAQSIADRASLAVDVAEPRLDAMAAQGLIMSVIPEQGTVLYHAIPWVVGIWELQINRLTEDFMQAVGEYYRTRVSRRGTQAMSQMRTIPIGESISPDLRVLAYEQVAALIANQQRMAVTACICRHEAKLHGGGCDAPEESCLTFGDWADYYIRTGRGREIDRNELEAILARADDANLVLQPSNSQDVSFICCCCGCCCGILAGIKRQPKPSQAVINAFIAQLDAEACIGCWTCLERCQMDALSDDGDRVALDADRCIGCGLCVSTCPSGALTLVRKADGPWSSVPETMGDTWRTIKRDQDAQRATP